MSKVGYYDFATDMGIVGRDVWSIALWPRGTGEQDAFIVRKVLLNNNQMAAMSNLLLMLVKLDVIAAFDYNLESY